MTIATALIILEWTAYGWSLLSFFLIVLKRYRLGYLIGTLDIALWTILALAKWNAPGMLVVEAVYLVGNLWGYYKNRKETWFGKDKDHA